MCLVTFFDILRPVVADKANKKNPYRDSSVGMQNLRIDVSDVRAYLNPHQIELPGKWFRPKCKYLQI